MKLWGNWALQPQHTIVGLCLLIGAVLTGVVAFDTQREYQHEIETATLRTQNLTRVLEEHTRQSMRRVEWALARASREIKRDRHGALTDLRHLRASLVDMLPLDGLMRAFVLVDRNGFIVLSTYTLDGNTNVSFADRDYFQAHLGHADQGMVIGAAVKSRLSGDWIIPVSIRLSTPSGGFDGVLLASLELSHFQRFYESIDVGQSGFVALLTRSAWVVAGAPFNESGAARNWANSPLFREHLPLAPSNTVRQVIAADGRDRIYSYRALQDYPLLVTTGVSMEEILSPWHKRVWIERGTLLIVFLGLATVAYILLRQLREKRHANDTLQYSEQRLRAIIENEPECVTVVDASGQLLEMNAAGLAMLESPSVAHLQSQDLLDLVLPEYRRAFAEMHLGTLSGERRTLEYEITGLKGTRRWLETHTAPIRNSVGQMTMQLSVTRDITGSKRAHLALRESEFRFRAVFEQAAVGFAQVDVRSGRFIRINQRYCDIVGYTRSEMLKQNFSAITHPDDIQISLDNTKALTDGTVREFALEKRYLRKDGSTVWVMLNVSAMWEPGATPDFNITVVEDITERKRTQEALQASLKDKEALLKEVHHRVKNNLQIITSLLRLEGGRSQQVETKAVLMDMKARIHSMALLHESLYRSGTLASINLGHYLKQLATQALRTLGTEPGAVQLHLALGDLQVGMDQATPCGLLVNELISNCLKHGFPAGRKGRVSVELKSAGDGTRWILRVSDTGVGLPADFATRQTASLGMQLVSDLARQINGTLQVESGSGSGAAFTITFTPEPL